MTANSLANPLDFSGADTYRKYVTPAIQSAGWGDAPFEIAEQRSFTDDLLFSNVFVWKGAIAVTQPGDAGRVGSHRFISCVPHNGLTTAAYLRYYFLTDDGMTKIRDSSPGGAGRNRTLGLSKLMTIEVPIPTLTVQHQFVELINALEKSVVKRADQKLIADAMLPSLVQSLMVQQEDIYAI